MTIERLEARIAPASLSGNVLTYTDVDGDLVSITFKTTGKLSEANFTFDTEFASTGAQKLDTIDLFDRRYEGASITMTVEKVEGGDGRADIRLIDASRVDLRNVTLLGDLSEMRGGDADPTPAVRRLEVYSLGNQATPAGPEDVAPRIVLFGGLKELQVTTDIKRVEVSAAGKRAHIGSVSVGGSLIGGEALYAGSIFATGSIGNVIIGGDVAGGSGELTGAIRADRGIGSVSVGGSLVGGEGIETGSIEAVRKIGSVVIGGDILGGSGENSGRIDAFGKLKTVVITGSVVGGEGGSSGSLMGGRSIGAVTITRDLTGGDGEGSAEIRSGGNVGLFQVNGSIIGGTGGWSGLNAGGRVNNIVVLGDVVGGEGIGSAYIFADGKIRAATIKGSIIGGSGNFSGQLFAWDGMGRIGVLGSLIGGEGHSSGSIETLLSAKDILVHGSVTGGAGDLSGKIRAPNIAAVTIGRSLLGGTGQGSGTVSAYYEAGVLFGGEYSGFPEISGRLAKVIIGGDLRGGSADFTGSVRAGLLGSVTIRGDMLGGAGVFSGFIGGNSLTPVKWWTSSPIKWWTSSQADIQPSRAETQAITIGGNLISGDGNFSGSIATPTSLTSLKIAGDVVGNSSNPVRVIVRGSAEKFSNESIGTVQIGGSTTYLDILAGYGVGGKGDQPELIAVNDQVRIGRVAVQGNWTAGNIVAGVKDIDGNGFGNRDDVSNFLKLSPFISTIASIQIGGSVSGTPAAENHFGFTAEWIKNAQIGGINVPLTPGPGNDQLLAVPGVTTGDFTINELK